jgi:hypothetical protein
MSPIVNTSGISIDDETMIRYSYTGMALNPKPEKLTFIAAYRAQNKWYFISDKDGTGQLVGDGSGAISYTTGSWSITLKEYPDLGSRIILGWGSFQEVERQSDAVLEYPKYHHTLQSVPVKPGSVSITWTVDGSVKTATDNNGALEGDGTGFILYGKGEIEFIPGTLPDRGTFFNITYDKYPVVTENFHDVQKAVEDGYFKCTLSQEPILDTVHVKTRLAFGARTHISSHQAYYVSYYRYPAQPGPGSSVFWPATQYLNYYTPKYYFMPGEGVVQFRYAESHYITTEGGRKMWIKDYIVEAAASSDGSMPIGEVNQVEKKISIFDSYWLQYRYRYPVYTRRSGVCGCHWERVYRWRYETSNNRTWNTQTDIEVSYTPVGSVEENITEQMEVQKVQIDLTEKLDKSIVPNSVAFTLGGHTYFDIEGLMYRDPNTAWVGTECGEINYDTGEVRLDWWEAGNPDISVRSMLVMLDPYLSNAIDSYTTLAPLRPQSFQIAATSVNGNLLTGVADAEGIISGDYIFGNIDVENGTFSVSFGERILAADLTQEEKDQEWYDDDFVDDEGYIIKPEPVFPNTVRYNCVAYVYLPLSEDILGLSPVRLPFDGKVPIYRVGDVLIVHHTKFTEISSPSNGQVVDLGRVRLSWVKIRDGNDEYIDTSKYSVNLDAGTVTLLDIEGYITPIKIYDRIEDMSLINDLRIDGTLTVTKTLSHDFPLGSYASSALILKDMFGHISNVFEQKTWQGDWEDELVGDMPTGRYNDTLYPITVDNEGSTQERWSLVFTNVTSFKVLGEFSGQIAVGSTNEDCSPTNPATGRPYFTVKAVGWGAGWAAGNCLRFNSIAANKPIWVARTILQSENVSGSDKFCIEVRGDVNTD